jgi:glycosyltransferase involved in cell wall biosynthesis
MNLFPIHDLCPSLKLKRKAFLMNTLNKPYSFYRLKRGDYDLFHQTNFETYCLHAIGKKKMVTTFHDMNLTKFHEMYHYNFYHPKGWMVSVQKKSIARADKVIAISQATKKDLIDYWDINPEKIEVIHHGVDKNKIQNLPSDRIVDFPYLLFVGDRAGYKNFDRLLTAFSLLAEKNPGLKLICTGKTFDISELKHLEELKVSQNVIQISANERTMAQLYRDAEFFVYPSLSEGFGMPILEAMVYDCPVALSNTSCLPEVAGNAGLYFDPYQTDDIYLKISQLLESKDLRSTLIQLGQQRLTKFSWEKSAEEHLGVYRSLL